MQHGAYAYAYAIDDDYTVAVSDGEPTGSALDLRPCCCSASTGWAGQLDHLEQLQPVQQYGYEQQRGRVTAGLRSVSSINKLAL